MLWGIVMAAVGVALYILATTRRTVVYKVLEARARVLWKGKARTFLQISGLIIAVLGSLWAAGIIW